MKKILITLAALALIATGCTTEEMTAPQPTPQTYRFTVSMPGGEPQTRVTKAEEGLYITLAWEQTDVLKLLLDQAGNYYKASAAVATLSADKKTATFTVTLPDAATGFDAAAPFDLYGAYGGAWDGNFIRTDDFTDPATLANASMFLTLEPKAGVTAAGLAALNLKLVHKGSLYALHIKNTAATAQTINGIVFKFPTAIAPRAPIYNLIPQQYIISTITDLILMGNPSKSVTIEPGASATLWQWAALTFGVPGTFEVIMNGTSSNSLNRATPFEYGKVYHAFTEWNGTAVTLLSAPEPTDIAFVAPAVYTWPGKITNLGITLTHALAKKEQVQWNYTPDVPTYPDGMMQQITFGNWHSYLRLGNTASQGFTHTLTATLPNGVSKNVAFNSRLNIWGNFGSDNNFGQWMNQGASVSWIKTQTTLRVRAYYAKNATEFALNNASDPEAYLTKIPTSEYTITSLDADVEVTKDADGVTYILTRKNFDTLKNVTITYTFGEQVYTDKLTLQD